MRLFIAIDIPEYLTTPLKESIKTKGLNLTKDSHLTLKFLGDVEDPNPIIEKLKTISFKPFKISLNKTGVFPNNNYIRVVWVDIQPKEQTITLQKQITEQLSEFKEQYEFSPHITLARVKFLEDKESFLNKLNLLKLNKETFEVTHFKLIKSTLTSEGPVYEDIATYPQPL